MSSRSTTFFTSLITGGLSIFRNLLRAVSAVMEQKNFTDDWTIPFEKYSYSID
ncbi:MAG: hypothetical protein R2941_22420 [Desulfobacterales bacterium]